MPPPAAPLRTLTIDHVGAQGDGRAREGDRWVSVPFTLAGEVVEVSGEGDRLRLERISSPSSERTAPSCRHFTRCGGCTLQHMAPAPYAAFKRDLIVRALKTRGLEAEVTETWITPPASRRRATFTARKSGKTIMVGFHGRKSHELIALEECPVARPAIVAALPKLAGILAPLFSGKEDLSLLVTETASGLDLHVTGIPKQATRLARAEVTSAALRAGFARVSLEGEDVLTERPPRLPIGAASLLPPPGGFLQASAEAETEIARLVLGHLGGAKHAADLFSGCGTFALRLAERIPVFAAESGRPAIEALRAAANAAPGLKPVTADVRDLFRNPLAAVELARFDGLVLDPPRAGASAQAAEIARSTVPRVAYVSCDPATLARDLRALVDGGYRLLRAHPVDQFLWSAHVEAVALLEKP
ncbi:putative 23S rRNA (uracil-5-)-methyltransferase RumA [Hyphomonas neptunium ATCC 15444]|uniref:Putative 23S rRNA (Uracil-5-)-methyltransferase RumA n=2 Tax=Hyphomonas TaxID=85 RepID=Q0BYI3_HYPNA|nr:MULTISPECIES: class I SAM-dependent RNA methyltransferase [Hyphomonas]ABI77665.1 putative 23S rRNA (uracil-5-)-methyltransferase RumA [Hyphomonas neptunium ATCC 15444]KCZ87068.1 putative 23S rRNA (uracil-5-)-methyltransferase RumA [Hyphomonas hirschiana VP5]